MKDKTIFEEEAKIPDGTTRQELMYELEKSTTRKQCRKEQNKFGESLITTSFQVQLESAGQWYHWVVELESNLKMILGAQGIPLSYVISENDAPDQTERNTWEEKAVLAVPLTGILYKQYNLTVHIIIPHNITDTSDSFTYVNPYINKDYERSEIKALRIRYEMLPCKSSTLERPSAQFRPSSIETKKQ